jgi:hypothetical protein
MYEKEGGVSGNMIYSDVIYAIQDAVFSEPSRLSELTNEY